jgi:hypothetical protein
MASMLCGLSKSWTLRILAPAALVADTNCHPVMVKVRVVRGKKKGGRFSPPPFD